MWATIPGGRVEGIRPPGQKKSRNSWQQYQVHSNEWKNHVMLCRWDTVITNQITSACPHEGEGHICAGNGVPMWASELWNVMTETWEMPVLTRITSNEQLGKISSSLKTALVESQLAVFVGAQAMPLNAPNIFLNYDALKKVKFLMGKD